MIWHLMKTGHRPKHYADVICLDSDGEALKCYYDGSDDTFIPYDREFDMQPFSPDFLEAWCFDSDDISDSDLDSLNNDFIEFSKTHEFPPLKKKQKVIKENIIIADDFGEYVKNFSINRINKCSQIALCAKRKIFVVDCIRYALHNSISSICTEIPLTQRTMDLFNDKTFLKSIEVIKFCDDSKLVISEFSAEFVGVIHNKHHYLPRNRPFKFIDGDKFVAIFRSK